MKLYVCYGTFWTPQPGGHPCHNAYDALRRAGYEPEVIRVFGFRFGPSVLRANRRRREVQYLSGQALVPVLVTDEDDVIHESKRIVEWAEAHPAKAAEDDGPSPAARA